VRPFEYYEPRTLDEAISLLQNGQGRANLLNGGTDLLVEIKEHLRAPEAVINIKRIPGLGRLTYGDQDGLSIGGLVTIRQVETSPVVKEKYAGLAQAAAELGSIQVRNRATVAGNICCASPWADTLPPLIADAAVLRIAGPDGERTVLMEEFFTGPGRTVLSASEILIEIIIPPPPPHTGKTYIKHGRRQAMELATVGVGVSLTLDGERCGEVRIVLGAVAPTPIRARAAEGLLRGAAPVTPELIAAAARKAMEESRPTTDVRGTAEYRREMVRVLTRRALDKALGQAKHG
jgi:carbon-monoxide dehydrogenase medium subunit